MKKSKLLIKTWLTTMVILTLIMGIIYLYLYFYSVNHEVVSYNEEFSYVFSELESYIEKYGIDNDELKKLLPNNRYHAVIYDEKNTAIFPVETIYDVHMNGILVAEEDTTVITEIGWDDAYFQKEKQASVYYNDKKYDLNLVYFGQFNWLVFYNLIRQILPVFFLGTITISTVFAFFYNYYFNNKVNKLVKIISEMKASSERISYERLTGNGSEFDVLEEQLYDMYDELQNTIDQLATEMDLRIQLEENRFLFMKNSTHELKTPLMVLSSSIEYLLDHPTNKKQWEQSLLLCYAQIEQLTSLVSEILDLSQLENVIKQDIIDATKVIQNIRRNYQFLLDNKDIEFTVMANDVMTLKCSEKHFYKIISNLMSNAIKFAPNNSQIKLLITDTKLIMENEISTTEAYDDIMEAFVTHDTENGHGLGLHFVAQICSYYEIKYDYEYDLERKKFIFKLVWK